MFNLYLCTRWTILLLEKISSCFGLCRNTLRRRKFSSSQRWRLSVWAPLLDLGLLPLSVTMSSGRDEGERIQLKALMFVSLPWMTACCTRGPQRSLLIPFLSQTARFTVGSIWPTQLFRPGFLLVVLTVSCMSYKTRLGNRHTLSKSQRSKATSPSCY